jgi:hypothetical protein
MCDKLRFVVVRKSGVTISDKLKFADFECPFIDDGNIALLTELPESFPFRVL